MRFRREGQERLLPVRYGDALKLRDENGSIVVLEKGEPDREFWPFTGPSHKVRYRWWSSDRQLVLDVEI